MARYFTHGFARMDGRGSSRVYYTEDGNTLGYVDYFYGSDVASVWVHDPATEKGRAYRARPKARAEAIMQRHLARNGYGEEVHA